MGVKETVEDIMDELIDVFDEYVLCLFYAVRGIEDIGQKQSADSFSADHQTWVASGTTDNPKYHARIKTHKLIEKCKRNGSFSNELAKSILCMMYSLWDEVYRHRISKALGIEAQYLVCPLMGDLRKIRHCILHNKSIIPERNFKFEVLQWAMQPNEKLEISFDMFTEFNDNVRGIGMKILSCSPPPAIKELCGRMTSREKKSFDNFYKNFNNIINGIEWPGLQNFLTRIQEEEK